MDTKTATGLNLTDEELDQATRRLAFFSPTSGKKYVNDLFEFIAEQTLASLPHKRYSCVEVFTKARELIGIKFEYEELLSGLHSLVNNKRADCDKESVYTTDATFSLEREIYDKESKRVKEHKDFEKNVISKWKEEVARLYTDISKQELSALENDLREYVYRLVSQNSVESVLLYYSGNKTLEDLSKQLSTFDINKVMSKSSQRLKMIRREALPAFLNWQTTIGRNSLMGYYNQHLFYI